LYLFSMEAPAATEAAARAVKMAVKETMVRIW
jgi:hypothetical protein